MSSTNRTVGLEPASFSLYSEGVVSLTGGRIFGRTRWSIVFLLSRRSIKKLSSWAVVYVKTDSLLSLPLTLIRYTLVLAV